MLSALKKWSIIIPPVSLQKSFTAFTILFVSLTIFPFANTYSTFFLPTTPPRNLYLYLAPFFNVLSLTFAFLPLSFTYFLDKSFTYNSAIQYTEVRYVCLHDSHIIYQNRLKTLLDKENNIIDYRIQNNNTYACVITIMKKKVLLIRFRYCCLHMADDDAVNFKS